MEDDYVATTCSKGTAALFLPSQVLDTTHPVLAPPLHFLTLAAPLQVVSFGVDATLSRSVRPSTRSRRGRRGSGQLPRSASPDATRRSPAGEESGDDESPEGKAHGAGTSDGPYHRSPGRRTGFSTGSPTAVAVLERARRDHQFARETRSGGDNCLLYTSPSPRDGLLSRMPSSA